MISSFTLFVVCKVFQVSCERTGQPRQLSTVPKHSYLGKAVEAILSWIKISSGVNSLISTQKL